MSAAEEIMIDLPSSKIAALVWGPKDGKTVLALHGWLDNAASFAPIAPFLNEYRLIALDLPGHGFSDHIPPYEYFHLEDYVPTISNVLNYFKLDKCALLGHSLGAGLASLFAGIFPERLTALGLIDGIGPIAVSELQLPDMMRKSIEEYETLANKKLTFYQNKEDAVQARLSATKMSNSAANLIVTRGLKETEQGYIWRTDPRLLLKPLSMFCESQIAAFLKRITTHTCLLRPSPGWPFDEKVFAARVGYLHSIEVHRISGDHHIHMDHPEIVGPILHDFYKRNI